MSSRGQVEIQDFLLFKQQYYNSAKGGIIVTTYKNLQVYRATKTKQDIQ